MHFEEGADFDRDLRPYQPHVFIRGQRAKRARAKERGIKVEPRQYMYSFLSSFDARTVPCPVKEDVT